MTADWHELPIYRDHPDEPPATFGTRLDAMRTTAAERRPSEAFDEGLDLALALHYAGQHGAALELLDELGSFVGEEDVDPGRLPWLFNARGVALSGTGRHAEADAQYRRAQELAEELADESTGRHITSTVLQNRGILAVETDEPQRAVQLLREALAMKVELDDLVAALDIFNSLALAYAALGRLDEAEEMLSKVEQMARQLDDPVRLGSGVGNRGVIRVRRGELAGAEADFRTALRYARSARDLVKELLGMTNVARVLADQGEHGQALRWYRRAARRAAETRASAYEIGARRGAALTLLRLDRSADALPEMERAVELANELGNLRYTAECLADLGALHVQLGDDDRARCELLAAQRDFVALEDRAWQARVARNLGELALSQGALAKADEWWTAAMMHSANDPESQTDIAYRAAEAWISAGNTDASRRWLNAELESAARFEEGSALAWRNAYAGALLASRGRDRASLMFFQEAARQFDELGEDRSATRVRLDVAANLSDLGRHADALEQLDLCLSFADEHSDRVVRRAVLSNLGEIARRSGELERAQTALEEAVALARALEDDEGLAHSLGNLGRVLSQRGEHAAAPDVFAEQLSLAKRLDDDQERASAFGGLAGAALRDGRFARAARYYRRAVELYAGQFAPGEVENLGGWLESVVELNREDEIQTVAQALVDAARASGLEATATSVFAHVARVLLRRGERQAAVDFYSAAIRLQLAAISDTPDASAEQGFAILGERLIILVSHVDVDLPNDERGPFYDQLIASISESLPDLGEVIRRQLDAIRAEMEEHGLLDDLRAAEQPD